MRDKNCGFDGRVPKANILILTSTICKLKQNFVFLILLNEKKKKNLNNFF